MRKSVNFPGLLRLEGIGQLKPNIMLNLETNYFPALYRMLVIPIYEDLNEM